MDKGHLSPGNDLSDRAGKRNDKPPDTARRQESNDASEKQSLEKVSTPDDDNWAENKVGTSIDGESLIDDE